MVSDWPVDRAMNKVAKIPMPVPHVLQVPDLQPLQRASGASAPGHTVSGGCMVKPQTIQGKLHIRRWIPKPDIY